jgi:serine/threonine protein kinase
MSNWSHGSAARDGESLVVDGRKSTIVSDDLLKRGHKLGRYEVRELIGQGGMGQVYRAWDEILGRDVAVKVLTVLDQDMLKRFAREAAAIGRLENHNVVEIHDLSTAGPHPHIVMEYLRGESLHARLQRGPLEIEDAVEVMLGVCCGVHACHRVGIVHRDIKPANVFLSQTIEYGVVVKVLDFGVAKPVRIARHDDVTGPGIVVGTPRYLAPEVLRGEDADQLSDQYQIGLLLYVCLTGQPPFAGKEGKELIQAVLFADHPTPREQRRGVSVELEQVVLRAMKAERGARFPSVLEMARVLVPHSGARNRAPWQQVFEGWDESQPAGKASEAIGSAMKVPSPVIALDTTRVLRGDQVARLAKGCVVMEPTAPLPKDWQDPPAARGSTRRFTPVPLAAPRPSQELPPPSTRVLPARGGSDVAPPSGRMASEPRKRMRYWHLGLLAFLLIVGGLASVGAVVLRREPRVVPGPRKAAKVLVPIPAADTSTPKIDVTDARDVRDLGTNTGSSVGANSASQDRTEARRKRARARDVEKRQRPRQGGGVEYTREGSPILD